jgi:hypothetical protein
MSISREVIYVNDNSQARPGRAGLRELELSSLLGRWKNTNPATGGIAEISIREANGALEIQVFGACSPTYCDWGVQPATAYAYEVTGSIVAGFELTYQFGDQQALVTAIHNRGVLVIHTYHKFTDSENRANYICKEFFVNANGETR